MCSHELCASNTRSRGASKTRVMTISRSDGVVTVSWLLPLPPITFSFPRPFELVQVLVQPVAALLPEPTVPLGPIRRLLERPGLEPSGPPLALPAPRDQPGALQDLEVLGDRGKSHREGLGQLGDRRVARGQPLQDRPASRVGERRKSAVQVLGCHLL